MAFELKIPQHIGFIMDGNGRWAKARMMPRKMGHREGVKAMKRIIEASEKMGIKYVTFYAFSTENWARPQEEIDELFKLVKEFADKQLDFYVQKGYKVNILGDLTQLPDETRESLQLAIDKSLNNKGLNVNIALNYGGRQEILRAVNMFLQSGMQEVDMQMLSDCMYTSGMPDPDVIVRSSGEKRISNFLIWQCAYSEFIFLDKHWPDFDSKTLDEIIMEYSRRDRRFGKVKRLD